MSTITAPDRPRVRSSRSISALNLINGTWVEGLGSTSRDIFSPADTAELLADLRQQQAVSFAFFDVFWAAAIASLGLVFLVFLMKRSLVDTNPKRD